jgi:hypothetical protein
MRRLSSAALPDSTGVWFSMGGGRSFTGSGRCSDQISISIHTIWGSKLVLNWHASKISNKLMHSHPNNRIGIDTQYNTIANLVLEPIQNQGLQYQHPNTA